MTTWNDCTECRCSSDQLQSATGCPRRGFHAGPGFAFVDTKALGGPKYRGPERRVPLDSPLLLRVVLALLGFWVAVSLLAPLAVNLWARWAS